MRISHNHQPLLPGRQGTALSTTTHVPRARRRTVRRSACACSKFGAAARNHRPPKASVVAKGTLASAAATGFYSRSLLELYHSRSRRHTSRGHKHSEADCSQLIDAFRRKHAFCRRRVRSGAKEPAGHRSEKDLLDSLALSERPLNFGKRKATCVEGQRMAPPPARLEVEIAAGHLVENDRWQATHFRVCCQLGVARDSLLRDQLQNTAELIGEMLKDHSRFSKRIAVGRRDADLSQPTTSPTRTARHNLFNYHSHGREPGVERYVAQRAPAQSLPPLSEATDRQRLRPLQRARWRPLQRQGSTAGLCLNCTTADQGAAPQ